MSLLEQPPSVAARLEPHFSPAYLGHRAFRALVRRTDAVPCVLALYRADDDVSVFETELLPSTHSLALLNSAFVERVLKFLLWQQGAYRVQVAGPHDVANALRSLYRTGGARAFDAELMAKVYDQPEFIVEHVPAEAIPEPREKSTALGGHLDGCRIGFDAGGSDRKVAAVIDGREVFSCEVPWEPKLQSNPDYHVEGIDDSIRRAAEHLPRIDAIGISSAGIYVNNRTRVASLFRKVPEELFESRIAEIYLEIAKKWGNVPVAVANDGDVAALAGAMDLGDHPVLGIAMGTSLAAGYVDRRGLITGWLNELAFAPIDYAHEALLDHEWSGDRGTGVNYLSQEAAIRLAPRVGVLLPDGAPPGERLRQLQEMLERGDDRIAAIFETIGVFFGYALLHYYSFYELKHVLVLGRVTSGVCGELIVDKACEVLDAEEPTLAARIKLHLPDEASRRVGQSIAAASLPRGAAS